MSIRLTRWLLVGFCLLCLASCASQPIDVWPPYSLPESFSQSGSDPLPDMWWTVFKDHELNALMAQALEYNFSLKTAWDRLDQAHAAAAKSGARATPSVAAGPCTHGI